MPNNIAILLALNDPFVLSMKVFLLSLLKTNPWFNLDVLLLSDGQLSEANVDALKKIYKNIKVIEAKKEDYVNCLPTSEKWGFNLYYRFDVFDMGNLGYDRIIIFDSDMVFLSDIKELFDYKQDFATCEKYLGIPEINPESRIEQMRKRFNCGLMSISKNLFDSKHKAALIKLAENKVWSSDQPVFNVYFADTAYYMPQKFNIVSSIATLKSLQTACIIQYHGFVKPWHSDSAEDCFEDFVKKEIKINGKAMIAIITKLKNIFDDYSKIATTYE